jgi:hypothetical protein
MAMCLLTLRSRTQNLKSPPISTRPLKEALHGQKFSNDDEVQDGTGMSLQFNQKQFIMIRSGN